MKKSSLVLLVCGLMLSAGNVQADTITKPHTFIAGDPALASQVNSNFDTVYDQVNKVGTAINVDGSNNVGIGKAPTSKLDVDGTITATGFLGVDWSSLSNIPQIIQDFAGLTCSDGQIAKYVGTAWACVTETGYVLKTGDTMTGTLDIATTGTDKAIIGSTTGSESVAQFSSYGTSAQATVAASHNGAGAAVAGRNFGTGKAGLFEILAVGNSQTALYGRSQGTGSAGYFAITNPLSYSSTIIANSDGRGNVISAASLGPEGAAGDFGIIDPTNPSAAIFADTQGTGYAAHFNKKVLVNGNLDVYGTISGNSFSGNGSGLTNVAASSVDWLGINSRPAGLDDGDDDTTYTGSNGVLLSGSDFQHADTSSLASVNNSNGTVIQDVTVDGFGHATGVVSTNLDSRYYTEAEADQNFVDFAGDLMTGQLAITTDETVALNVSNTSTTSAIAALFRNTSPTNSLTAVAGESSGVDGVGVSGNALGSGGVGGYFQGWGENGYGIRAIASADTGVNYGVYGKSASPGGYGLYSDGNAHVLGNLSVSGAVTGDGSGLTGVMASGVDWTGISNIPPDLADGDSDTTYTGSNGVLLSGSDFQHDDTSTLASVNNANGTVIQDVTVDGFGHATGVVSIDLDGRYYREGESDLRYVNITGDTMTGPLTVDSSIAGNTMDIVDNAAVGANASVSTTTTLNVRGGIDDTYAGFFESGDTSGTAYGLVGRAPIATSRGAGDIHYGVSGEAWGGHENYGLKGYANDVNTSSLNYGVYGEAANGANKYGIYGKAPIGTNSYAGYFDGDTTITNELTVNGNSAIGPNASVNTTTTLNVRGDSTDTYAGDFISFDVSGPAYGISGKAVSNTGRTITDNHYGVRGEAAGGFNNYGTYGYAYDSGASSFNYGVIGSAQNGGAGNYGVYGSASIGNNNYAGYFNGDAKVSGDFSTGGSMDVNGNAAVGYNETVSSVHTLNVRGDSDDSIVGYFASGDTTNEAYGVLAVVNSTTGRAVTDKHYGVYGDTSGGYDNFGLYGRAIDNGATSNYGVYGFASGGTTNYAGYFNGHTMVKADGNQWNPSTTEGDLKIGSATERLKIGVATSGGGAGISRIFADGTNPKVILGSGTTTDVLTVSDGNVGIGTINPTYKLHVVGSTYSTTGWSTSDERWKTNIHTLGDSLQKVSLLRGVSYDWRTDEFPDMGFTDRPQIGVIAQEVEEIIPELVNTDEDGYKAVAYDKLTAVLIEAVKELKLENDAKDDKIAALTELACIDHPEAEICQ